MRARLLLGIALAFAPIALLAQGQVTALYTYPSDPEGAATCLAQADNGNLYGGGYVFNPAFPAVAPTVFAVNSCSWLQGTDGNFYYWTNSTVTKVTPASVSTVIVNLGTSASNQLLDVIQASNGTFYGVAEFNGTYGAGTIFSFTSSGNATTLYDFTGGPDGRDPLTLLQGLDGDLYGSTYDTVFRYVPGGQLTVLASTGDFTTLVEGDNGILYGVTGSGSFASIASNGTVTTYPAASTLGYTGYGGPCFVGGDANIYCSGDIANASAANSDIVQFTPAGGAVTYIANPYAATSVQADMQYVLAGNGSFYGVLFYLVDNGANSYEDWFVYNATGATVTPAIDISLNNTQVVPGESTTLTWDLKNGFSDNMKLCFASGAWSGIQATSGSLTAPAPTTPGTYRYALTCGGVETSAATLYDAVPQITFTASPTELAVGVPITLTATVTGNNGTASGEVNIVDFYTNQTLLSIPLNKNGVATATVPTTGVKAGYYYLAANYTGSKSYAAAQSGDEQVDLLASKYTCTSAYVSVSPTTVSPGQTITLSGSAEGDGEATSGTVTFQSGDLTLGTASIPQKSPYEATLSLQVPQLPAGNYAVTATFNGNAITTGGCVSPPATVTVSGTPTSTLTLAASPTTVTPPATVTLTATQSTTSGKPAPTGTVDFYNGSTYLGASSLNGSGVTMFNLPTSGYSAGTITITADYLGDSNYTKDSATTSFTVQ